MRCGKNVKLPKFFSLGFALSPAQMFLDDSFYLEYKSTNFQAKYLNALNRDGNSY